jgi:hypothetical protein
MKDLRARIAGERVAAGWVEMKLVDKALFDIGLVVAPLTDRQIGWLRCAMMYLAVAVGREGKLWRLLEETLGCDPLPTPDVPTTPEYDREISRLFTHYPQTDAAIRIMAELPNLTPADVGVVRRVVSEVFVEACVEVTNKIKAVHCERYRSDNPQANAHPDGVSGGADQPGAVRPLPS